MSEKVSNLLTDGLAAGYAGTKKPDEIQRANFSGKANDYLSPDGGHYHDEWFADDNGGGQELVTIDNEQGTRLYAGGVIPVEELQKLDLSTKDVISRLITSVNELKGKTRLHESCSLDLPDGWKYTYEILKKGEEVPLTIGWESIKFNGREVFAHGHMISLIK
ncbi:MAG TPA: hypothetical protein VLE44_00940 [Candidatus Saccharimonadales bacterium]|nr:hypothetical protein [Candidatus Saccharimonadales bacterium]